MKQLAINISLVCLSLIVFTTGMGTTTFNFCCDNCVKELFSSGNRHNCETLPEEPESSCCHKKEIKTTCCDSHSQEKKNKAGNDCCKFERHSVDIDFVNPALSINTPFVWIADNIYGYVDSILSPVIGDMPFNAIDDPPDTAYSRNYLAFIQTFII